MYGVIAFRIRKGVPDNVFKTAVGLLRKIAVFDPIDRIWLLDGTKIRKLGLKESMSIIDQLLSLKDPKTGKPAVEVAELIRQSPVPLTRHKLEKIIESALKTKVVPFAEVFHGGTWSPPYLIITITNEKELKRLEHELNRTAMSPEPHERLAEVRYDTSGAVEVKSAVKVVSGGSIGWSEAKEKIAINAKGNSIKIAIPPKHVEKIAKIISGITGGKLKLPFKLEGSEVSRKVAEYGKGVPPMEKEAVVNIFENIMHHGGGAVAGPRDWKKAVAVFACTAYDLFAKKIVILVEALNEVEDLEKTIKSTCKIPVYVFTSQQRRAPLGKGVLITTVHMAYRVISECMRTKACDPSYKATYEFMVDSDVVVVYNVKSYVKYLKDLLAFFHNKPIVAFMTGGGEVEETPEVYGYIGPLYRVKPEPKLQPVVYIAAHPYWDVPPGELQDVVDKMNEMEKNRDEIVDLKNMLASGQGNRQQIIAKLEQLRAANIQLGREVYEELKKWLRDNPERCRMLARIAAVLPKPVAVFVYTEKCMDMVYKEMHRLGMNPVKISRRTGVINKSAFINAIEKGRRDSAIVMPYGLKGFRLPVVSAVVGTVGGKSSKIAIEELSKIAGKPLRYIVDIGDLIYIGGRSYDNFMRHQKEREMLFIDLVNGNVIPKDLDTKEPEKVPEQVKNALESLLKRKNKP